MNVDALAGPSSAVAEPSRSEVASPKSAWKLPTADDLAQLNSQRQAPIQLESQADKKGKPKDLSHVPCKFFKAGSCTAGPSCPFSHGLSQPGTSKPICQWYAKGSCKFGHKCALAHILPGQTMAMDRKNKRAAQAAARGEGAGPTPAEAAAALANSPPSANGRSQASALSRSLKQSNGGGSNNGKVATFFAGSTSSGDSFTSPLAGQDQLPTGPLPAMPGPGFDEDEEYNPYRQHSPGQLSTVTALSSSVGHSSPSKSSALSPPRMAMPILPTNAPPPGTSATMFGTSPFSGSRALFMPSSYTSDSDGEHFARSPPAPSRAFHQLSHRGEPAGGNGSGSALDTDDEGDEAYDEAFLPSSLNDLLTPDERRRRASKAGFGYSPPTVSLLHPLPQGIYSASFDQQTARDAWGSPSTSAAHGPGSLPGGLAAGLSQLHLQPAIHSGETPPSAVSLLFGSHPGQSSSLGGRNEWAQAGHSHPAWASAGEQQQQQQLGLSPSRPSPLGQNAPAALPRRMSSQLSSSISGYPSPLQQSISHDSDEVDDIQFEMDG